MQAFVMVTPMVHVNTLPAALGEGPRSVCKVNADVSLDIVPLVASVFSMYQRKICYNAHNAPVALAAGLGIATSTAAQLAAWMVSACANQVFAQMMMASATKSCQMFMPTSFQSMMIPRSSHHGRQI